jgi:hypothetical protein
MEPHKNVLLAMQVLFWLKAPLSAPLTVLSSSTDNLELILANLALCLAGLVSAMQILVLLVLMEGKNF